MTRELLPARRFSEIFDVRFGDIDYTVTVGRYPSKQIGEVFISCHKAGSAVANLARDAAVLMSLSIQHGVDLLTMKAAVTRSEDGTAAGLAGAVLDEIVRREAAPAPLPTVTDPIPSVPVEERIPIGFLPQPSMMPRLSGELCSNCGAAAMVRTGTCLTCQSCGSSSGGCS